MCVSKSGREGLRGPSSRSARVSGRRSCWRTSSGARSRVRYSRTSGSRSCCTALSGTGGAGSPTAPPTGALIASPTMGLPERIGGTRNWDYRYTWLRDAALALYALIYVGFEDEARKFMGWLTDRCQQDADGLLQPLYGIDGRKDITEVELTHLSGYMNSSPVRLGNGAFEQRQLDLYGAVLDAAYLYNKHGAPLDYDL